MVARRLAIAAVAIAVLAGIAPVFYLGLKGGAAPLDAYVWRVTRFTLLQAGLSTLLSLVLGIAVARALSRLKFRGRGTAIWLLGLPNALPAIVAVLGIVQIFGANGLLGGWFNLYGLTGILIAHTFFNVPLTARLGLSALEAIPEENRRLAAQLGFSSGDHWRHLERPALVAMLPGAALVIFLLCAASFAVVLTLGGGPAATTLEVAIYQALRSDFDPARATTLAIVQTAICVLLVIAAQRFPTNFAASPALRTQRTTAKATWLDIAALILGACLFIPPLIAIIASGLSSLSISPQLPRAALTSLVLGAAASLVCFVLCWPLATRKSNFIAVMAALILPPAVMATGWFILLSRFSDAPFLPAFLVIALNALMALPFAHTILAPAIAQHAATQDRLCASLGLAGFTRFRLIDAPALKRPITLALTLAAVVSLGDLTAISLFGSGDLLTLPALIYRDMGQYRIDSAAFTALVLASLAVALMAVTHD